MSSFFCFVEWIAIEAELVIVYVQCRIPSIVDRALNGIDNWTAAPCYTANAAMPPFNSNGNYVLNACYDLPPQSSLLSPPYFIADEYAHTILFTFAFQLQFEQKAREQLVNEVRFDFGIDQHHKFLLLDSSDTYFMCDMHWMRVCDKLVFMTAEGHSSMII